MKKNIIIATTLLFIYGNIHGIFGLFSSTQTWDRIMVYKAMQALPGGTSLTRAAEILQRYNGPTDIKDLLEKAASTIDKRVLLQSQNQNNEELAKIEDEEKRVAVELAKILARPDNDMIFKISGRKKSIKTLIIRALEKWDAERIFRALDSLTIFSSSLHDLSEEIQRNNGPKTLAENLLKIHIASGKPELRTISRTTEEYNKKLAEQTANRMKAAQALADMLPTLEKLKPTYTFRDKPVLITQRIIDVLDQGLDDYEEKAKK